jgi:hypothetical protein
MFYSEPTTLIVVYKDELLVNQIKKLVETKDDTDAETAVGTKDGTVNIVSWTEKVWLDQKKAGNINNKVLFLGDIKGTDKLTPVLDVKFDEFGVKYGWAGTQAVLFVDPQAIAKKEDYDAFLQKLNSLPVPEKLKAKVEDTPAPAKVGVGIAAFFGVIAAGIAGAAMFAKDVFTNKKAVKQQMLFYGIMNLYANHLEEFMNS